MPAPTAIHRIVDRCRAADYPAAIGRLDSGWVVLGERQVLPGYCLLLPDPVVPHLNALNSAERSRFLSDMTQVGDVLMQITGAIRINYAMFGNAEPALHAHLFPRHASEPDALRGAQPWALDWNLASPYRDAEHGTLKRHIAAELERTGRLRR